MVRLFLHVIVITLLNPRLAANVGSWEQFNIILDWCQLLPLLTCRLYRWANKQFQPIAADCVINGFCSLHKTFLSECLDLLLANLLCLLNILDWRWISLLSMTNRFSLYSSNGLSSPYITLTSEQTSFLNAFCTLIAWSWWSTSSRLPISWCASSKSEISAATPGPATIHHRRALGLSVRLTAPPLVDGDCREDPVGACIIKWTIGLIC